MVFQLERQFTSAGRAVHFTYFKRMVKRKGLLSAVSLSWIFSSVQVRLLRCAPEREENNPVSSKSTSLTFAGDGTTRRGQSAVK